jgi:hypothetical protein
VLLGIVVGCSAPPQQSFNPADLAITVGTRNPTGTTPDAGDIVTWGNYHLQVVDKMTGVVRKSIENGDVAILPRNAAVWGPVTDVSPPGMAPLGGCSGDPQIEWDHLQRRYVAIAFNVIHPATERSLCVAVSKSSDPLGGWWVISATPAGGAFDRPRLSHTQGRYCVTDTGGTPLRCYLASDAVNAEFSNVWIWPRPHNGIIVPVRRPMGTGYVYLGLWIESAIPSGAFVRLYRYRAGLVDEQWTFFVPGLGRTVASITPGGPLGSTFQATATPSISQAGYDWHSRTVWMAGNTTCGNGAWVCAYVAQLGLVDATGMVDLDSGLPITGQPTTFRAWTLDGNYAQHTLWPALAVAGNGGGVASAMVTSPTQWPTHVASFIPSPTATAPPIPSRTEDIVGVLPTASVENVCRHPTISSWLPANPGFSCSGNGPVPPRSQMSEGGLH